MTPQEEIENLRMQLSDERELRLYWERAGRAAVDGILDAALELAEAVQAHDEQARYGFPGPVAPDVQRGVEAVLRNDIQSAAQYILSAYPKMKQMLHEVSETITG